MAQVILFKNYISKTMPQSPLLKRFYSSAFVIFFVFFPLASLSADVNFSPSELSALKAMSPNDRFALARQYGLELKGSNASSVSSRQPGPVVTVEPRPSYKLGTSDDSSDRQNLADQSDLKPFGYELFAGEPTTFEPIKDVPVASDYVLGPNDSLKVQLYGKQSSTFELIVDTNGQIGFPELGPMSIAGLSFSEAKKKIIDAVSRRMIGVKADVSIGVLRSIRVFVLGDAYKPGSYVVSSLSTITNALVLSGGVSTTGSLRNIQVKRNGKVVKTLDLYDLLLNGDNSSDVRLRSGDVVFIPPVGGRIEVDGEVKRPAIYEFKTGETLKDVIRYSGGLTDSAYTLDITLSRIDHNRQMIVNKLGFSEFNKVYVRSGDKVDVPKVLDQFQQVVTLNGHVERPGTYELRDKLRVSSVIGDAGLLKKGADLRFGLVKRFDELSGYLSILAFNLSDIWTGDNSSNHYLKNGDELYVFDLLGQNLNGSEKSKNASNVDGAALDGNPKEVHSDGIADISSADFSNRTTVISQIIDELRYQSEVDKPSLEVEVTGSVRFPGVYPLIDGMTAHQLIYAAGGLTQQAYLLASEINRTSFNHLREREQNRFELNLENSESLDFALKPRDVLQIRSTPEWQERAFVSLKGEIRFPGRYSIRKGDTLREVLERAGGVTKHAYIPGAVFTRKTLQQQEQQRIDDMRVRLSSDITKAQLGKQSGASFGENVEVAQQLLDQLNNTPAIGRLVIDLSSVVSSASEYSVVLEDGDKLYVPPVQNSVSVIGEVQLPISQVYQANMPYDSYIENSGGTTESADEDRIYIIKANGSVLLPESSSWFSAKTDSVSPGDTIVVPLDADKVDQVVLWRDLSQIFYQVALGAAAVGSL